MTLYGHAWRTRVRPQALAKAGNRCERCGAAGRLDVAHLDQTPGHDAEWNLAAWCRRCHRLYDYRAWRRLCHEPRATRKDAARPLLAL
jgi:hypothetical protein